MFKTIAIIIITFNLLFTLGSAIYVFKKIDVFNRGFSNLYNYELTTIIIEIICLVIQIVCLITTILV